ncbi:MAG: hypothetical protein ABL885_02480 [Methylophilaceae bacterium]
MRNFQEKSPWHATSLAANDRIGNALNMFLPWINGFGLMAYSEAIGKRFHYSRKSSRFMCVGTHKAKIHKKTDIEAG